MSVTSLKFENPISDAITRIHFAPQSDNLFISSWDCSSKMRLEAPTEAALLDCCFQSESIAFTAASDGSITRFDLHSGNSKALRHHDDLAPCVECSDQTFFAVGSVNGCVALVFPTRLGPYEKGYMFGCDPKLNDGKCHLVAVSDIAFNPLSSGAIATGDYEGYVIIWDARSRKRIFELPRYPSSVPSLSFNRHGQLLAIASSYACTKKEKKYNSLFKYLYMAVAGKVGKSSGNE